MYYRNVHKSTPINLIMCEYVRGSDRGGRKGGTETDLLTRNSDIRRIKRGATEKIIKWDGEGRRRD